MAKKKRSQWASDAALQAIVRFGPEEQGLTALAQQARADYGTSVRQAHGTAAAVIDATQHAIPAVTRIYDQAGLAQARTAHSASLVSGALANLGPAADTIKAGSALEVAQQLGNLRSARSAALEDLQTRQVAARQGEGFAVQQARSKYVSDMSKLLERSQGLRREKGAFTASTINALAEAERKRQVTLRGQTLQAQTTRRGQDLSHTDRQASITQRREAAAQRAAQKAAETMPGGAKLATPQAHGKVADQVTQMASWIRANRGNHSRAEIARDMLSGVSPQTITDPKTGQKIRDPGVPKAPSALALSAALDVVYNGGISNGTAKRLHERGYSVTKLGLKPARPKPKPLLVNPWTARVRG